MQFLMGKMPLWKMAMRLSRLSCLSDRVFPRLNISQETELPIAGIVKVPASIYHAACSPQYWSLPAKFATLTNGSSWQRINWSFLGSLGLPVSISWCGRTAQMWSQQHCCMVWVTGTPGHLVLIELDVQVIGQVPKHLHSICVGFVFLGHGYAHLSVSHSCCPIRVWGENVHLFEAQVSLIPWNLLSDMARLLALVPKPAAEPDF